MTDGTSIYIFGGGYGTAQERSRIIKYVPSTGTITTLAASLPSARSRTSAIWDGTNAYIFGGAPDEGPYLSDILRFNPATEQVTKLSATLPSGTSASTAIWDGANAYIIGGDSNTGRQIVRFTPSTGAVATMASSLPLPVVDSSVIYDGYNAYLFGGWRGGQNVDPIVRFTPATDSVSQLSTTLPSGRRGTSAIWDGSNAYVFGGWAGTELSQIVRYTPDAPPPNAPPSCSRDSAGETIQVQVGETVTFSATCTDGEGRWQGNAWNLDGSPDGPSDSPPTATSWTTQRVHSWSSPGSHSLMMAARDHLGLNSNVVAWDITVAGGTVPPAAPAPPTGTSPGTPSQAEPETLRTLAPTLTWGASPGATNYFVNIRRMSDNVLVLNGQNVGNVASWQVPLGMLDPETTYRWAVQAGNAAGTSTQSTPVYIRTPSALVPVVFLHGIDAVGPAGADAADWEPMLDRFVNAGWNRGKLAFLGYYGCDTNVPFYVHDYGLWPTGDPLNHASGLPSGRTYQQDHTFEGCGRPHNADTSIEHLAYHWAWTIYRIYQAPNLAAPTCINVVAHSMGGLITKYAIQRVQEGDSSFPPSICVKGVVTFGSPLGGTEPFKIGGLCNANGLVNKYECRQMDPADTASRPILCITAGNQACELPRGTGGTAWTTIGSDADSVVSADSAMHAAAARKIRYLEPSNIGHVTNWYGAQTQGQDSALAEYGEGASIQHVSYHAAWPVRLATFVLSDREIPMIPSNCGTARLPTPLVSGAPTNSEVPPPNANLPCYFTIAVPTGARSLTLTTSPQPGTETFFGAYSIRTTPPGPPPLNDPCRTGDQGACTIANPAPGVWRIRIDPFGGAGPFSMVGVHR